MENKNQLILVSGPTKGGKSEWAEHLLKSSSKVTYIASCQKHTNDADWKDRLEKHRQRRPKEWQLIESPTNLVETLGQINSSSDLLIDSLGGFVSTQLHLSNEEWTILSMDFVDLLALKGSKQVIVNEEVGWSIVSSTRLGNLFVDRLGVLAKQIEVICYQSWLLIHGRPIYISLLAKNYIPTE